MKIHLTIAFIVLCCISSIQAQDKKTLNITRTTTPPKIDGVLDDAVWQTAEEAKDFIQYRPDMGVKEPEESKTVAKITYDDDAIYISAYLYDDPSKIMTQFNSRDNFGQSDFLMVILNPNNDAQNNTYFVVFSSGNQADAVASSNNEDFGWNAVWESAVKINDDGWAIEMKIPYRALRFSNEEVQTWGLQLHREFRRSRTRYTWSPIDATKGFSGLYHGEIKGIKNIEPPTRLSFYPFMSGISKKFDGSTETDFNVGLDVKYGITENFTLDATLIPDFSQAAFDNLTLNLGPFEQTFGEQRQFFKEGVDLFNKGNLFFSRRVGSAPTGDVELEDNEELVDYPNEVKVLNAIKISGRTKKGLGIGVFNAITEKTEATIKRTEEFIDPVTNDLETEISYRHQVVEPFSNYNILVLDQQYNGNSSIGLVNTNVMRSGNFRDANVTALVADITNKRNTYNIRSDIKMSNVSENNEIETGMSSFFFIRKVHGNYRYSFDHSYADTKYDNNDLGLSRRNNYSNFGIDVNYRIFEPTEKLNQFFINTWVNYRRLANPSTYTGGNGGISFNAQDKKLLNFGGNINYQFGKQFDYFEPRTEGRFFIYENRLNANAWISTDYNKFFAVDTNIGGATGFEEGRNTNTYWFGFRPRFKFSEKFIVSYNISVNNTSNGRGYVTTTDDDIVFGERDRLSMTNSISGSYNFNPYHGLTLSFRNNWDTVHYDEDLYTLQENGRLTQDQGLLKSNLEDDPDINFNTWNLDLSYSWQFAPGSFLTALYRNRLFNRDTASEDSYFDSLDTLLDQPIQHTFSLRLQYFIDYSSLKNVLKKKTS
ncbi:protein with DOMON-like ligand-binding domain protein [Flavobacteriales bacterium 34_180_T64]|nr:protein with DOMON-like ligand-binding domain protein [Flavobacteriales bacterium 34_180_T64]